MRQVSRVLAVLLIAAVAAPAAATAKVRKGPPGTAFYTPPSSLPGKAHGDLIWARKLTGGAALDAASSTQLVLYRSTGSDGKPIAVSGTVALPKGKPPRGGWPVVSWTHATTGIADVCAPSRDNGTNVAHVYSSYSYPLMDRWLKRGFAVVRTDYQGLGTPGTHEYLVGVPEGRSALDIVRAARQLDPRLGNRLALAGHSQGGHAALWAAALAPKWTPELELRGTVAFAPASHLSEQSALIPLATAPGGGLSGLTALIVRGLDASRPELGVQGQLSDRALALYPEIESKCLADLSKPDSFGGIAPADLFKPTADVAGAAAATDQNDPENLKLGPPPVLVEQGRADTTVAPVYSEQLVDQLRAKGASVQYKTYESTDHVTIVTTAAGGDSTSFLTRRLR